MPVGATIGFGQVDNIMSSLAVQMRDVMRQVYNLNLTVNGQGQGLAYLQSIGYPSTPNPANPGGVSDAQLALNMIAYLNTVAGVYFGTAVQTPAYNFDQQLSSLWAGRVASGF
jgi:hypothetical protein